MVTVGELIDGADIPPARKPEVKNILEQLGCPPDEAAGDAFRSLTVAQLREEGLNLREALAYPEEISHCSCWKLSCDRDQQPPTYAALPDRLPTLVQPLPMIDTNLQRLASSSLAAQRQLPAVAVSVTQQPAYILAEAVGYALLAPRAGSGKHLVVVDTWPLVIGLMQRLLAAFDIKCEPGGNIEDPSGATDRQKRPAAQLYLSDILMFKGEVKAGANDFDLAVEELHTKMANWSPAFHGSREYILCFAAAAHRLQFFAVLRGGASHKAISAKFDLTRPLDRLQVMHTTIRALTIVLQQSHHQLPANPLPLYLTVRHFHSRISYREDHVLKVVPWGAFPNADLATLTLVYDVLLSIPHGAHLQHPRGLITPLRPPKLGADKMWRVKMPLGLPLGKATLPMSLPRLRCLVADVLCGLAELHARDIVHRDVRKQNILEMCGGAFGLIDYEHSGVANAVPPFQPLYQYPPE
ncbi:g2058 [Coccomyxa elongata]